MNEFPRFYRNPDAENPFGKPYVPPKPKKRRLSLFYRLHNWLISVQSFLLNLTK